MYDELPLLYPDDVEDDALEVADAGLLYAGAELDLLADAVALLTRFPMLMPPLIVPPDDDVLMFVLLLSALRVPLTEVPAYELERSVCTLETYSRLCPPETAGPPTGWCT